MFQIGNSPRRIDILTGISGVGFQQAYERRTIANKRATGRTQDLADVERLESLLSEDR